MYKAVIFDFFGVLYQGGPEPIDADIVRLIKSLHGRYKTGLLSNSSAGYVPSLLDQYGLQDLFDDITVSGEVGVMKPDSEIFHHALQQLGVKAGEAVFIDDSPVNAVAAEAVGMRGITYTSVPALHETLSSLGVEVS